MRTATTVILSIIIFGGLFAVDNLAIRIFLAAVIVLIVNRWSEERRRKNNER